MFFCWLRKEGKAEHLVGGVAGILTGNSVVDLGPWCASCIEPSSGC